MSTTHRSRFSTPFIFLISLLIALVGVSCGGGGGGGGTPIPPAPTSFTVGGTITGLSNTGLVLQNNGGDDLNISAANGTFTFATSLSANSAYAVSIQTKAFGQNCNISNNSGTVTNANITDVVITCETVAFNDASGLYRGETGDVTTVGFDNVNGGTSFNLDFIRGIIYGNRFMFFNVDPKANVAADPDNGIVKNQNENVLIDGVISNINGNTITATASIYQAGQIVANDIIVTGDVTSRTNISLTLLLKAAVAGAPAGNFLGGSLNATFSGEFDRGASMARLETPADLAIDSRVLFSARTEVYMAIPAMRSLSFTIDDPLIDNSAYSFAYSNNTATKLCRNTGIISPMDVPLTIPNAVLNVYLLEDVFFLQTNCTVVPQDERFTGFGALLGESGSTVWWYATVSDSFSVYIESDTTP